MIIKLIHVLKNLFKGLWLKIASLFKKRVKKNGGEASTASKATSLVDRPVHGNEGGEVINDSFGNTYVIKGTTLVKFILAEGQRRALIPEGVTDISEGAFSDCTGLTEVVIPEGVTSIGIYAFEGCTGLTSVVIPRSMTSIGTCAFSDCTGITELNIPKDVTIGEDVFWGCTGITELNIPKDVTIGKGAFYRCAGITGLNIPEGVTITDWAFSDCIGITGLTISKDVSIGQHAFHNCTGITELNIPKGVTISDCSFYRCTGITKLNIPKGVTIEYSAFRFCTGITELNISKGVTVGDSAFGGCTGITELNIPKDATIGGEAFRGCKQLERLIINGAFTLNCNSFQDTSPNLELFIRQSKDDKCVNMINIVRTLKAPAYMFRSVSLSFLIEHIPEIQVKRVPKRLLDELKSMRNRLKTLFLIDKNAEFSTSGIPSIPNDIWRMLFDYSYSDYPEIEAIRISNESLTCEDLDQTEISSKKLVDMHRNLSGGCEYKLGLSVSTQSYLF